MMKVAEVGWLIKGVGGCEDRGIVGEGRGWRLAGGVDDERCGGV